MNKIIIGISGKKRAGKDTAAKVLQDKLSGATIMYFADTLKQVTALVLGLTLDHFYYDENKKVDYEIAPGIYMSGRELLQKIGTECFRNNIHTDFWVHAMMQRINDLPREIQYVIIPDVRFPNEYEAIKKEGGYVIRMERAGLKSIDNHPSETALDNYDFTRIDNSDGYMSEKFLRDINTFLKCIRLIGFLKEE